MSIGVVDAQRILVFSAGGKIARELLEESRETAGSVTQHQREQALLAMVLEDVAALVPLAAQGKGCAIVLEVRRSGVLHVNPATNPAEVVDLTADILAAYDRWIIGLTEQHGREALLKSVRDRLDGILKGPSEDTSPNTGMYL